MRARWRPAPLSLGVDENEGVTGYLGVVRLEEVLDGLVEILLDGRLLNDDRLGRRSRMRLRRLKRRQKRVRRWAFELEVDG